MPVIFKIENLDDNSLKREDYLPEGATEVTFKSANIQERYDLQGCMVNHFNDIFTGLGQQYHLIEQEHQMGSTRKRIDILAIDQNGHPVIMELKRGIKANIMSQVMGYAGIMAEYGVGEDFLRFINSKDKKDKLLAFLSSNNVELSELNASRSVIAVDEGFDIKTLGTVNWLKELGAMIQRDIIKALNVSLYEHGEDQYFMFEFQELEKPTVQPVLSDDTIPTREAVITKMRTQNSDAADWLQSRIEDDWYRKNNVVYFRDGNFGTRCCKCWIRQGRIKVSHLESHAKSEHARLSQFWQDNIDGIEVSKDSKELTFDLTTAEQFAQFETVIKNWGWKSASR